MVIPRMVIPRVRLVCFCFACVLLATLPALAASVRVVRLSLVQGDVQIDRNAGDGWEQAIVNMPVIDGVRIYAAQNSKAELEFEDGSNVRLAGPAQITLTELTAAPSGSLVNAIQIDSGEVYVNARLRNHDDFRISAYSGESFAITKPSHLRFSVNEQTASLAMNDGEAIAQNVGDVAPIRSGQTYNYILGQPASAARQEKVPAQPEDAWNQQRESYNDQNASAASQFSGAQSSEAQSPEGEDAYVPGQADLGYYGNYSDIPGYGESWQPNDVGPDWDPFDNGAWSYYPDWGWTFVSAYPWGWTPFYCGSWFHVHGRGWWWHRGPWHGPAGHPRPLVAAAPKGFRAPHPPAGVAHGTVAVAGSHLNVGPIGATHASASRGLTITRAPGTSTLGRTALRADPASIHPSAMANPGAASITGQRGSYMLNVPSSGHNGFEVHRPPSRASAPRNLSAPTSVSTSHGYAYNSSAGTGSAPHIYNVPVAPPPHATAQPPTSSAPHVSSGSGAVSHSSGLSGGGGSSFHGGGAGGGSFHGGGGGGGFHGGGGGHR